MELFTDPAAHVSAVAEVDATSIAFLSLYRSLPTNYRYLDTIIIVTLLFHLLFDSSLHYHRHYYLVKC